MSSPKIHRAAPRRQTLRYSFQCRRHGVDRFLEFNGGGSIKQIRRDAEEQIDLFVDFLHQAYDCNDLEITDSIQKYRRA